MKPTPEQIAKLPKWAQWELTRLERDNAGLQQKLDAAFKPCEYGALGLSIPDGMKGLTVPGKQILIGTSKFISLTVRIKEDGSVYINCQYYKGRLVVLPEVTNSITLSVVEI